jgi:hypothetical protein
MGSRTISARNVAINFSGTLITAKTDETVKSSRELPEQLLVAAGRAHYEVKKRLPAPTNKDSK